MKEKPFYKEKIISGVHFYYPREFKQKFRYQYDYLIFVDGHYLLSFDNENSCIASARTLSRLYAYSPRVYVNVQLKEAFGGLPF